MPLQFKFDTEKAVEVILYIAGKCPDKYRLLKSLYFADLDHLEKYGRFICGDSYKAMQYGPVPVSTYQLLDQSVWDAVFEPAPEKRLPFEVDGRQVKISRSANLDWLSVSDRECLDQAIANCADKSFDYVKGKSHDEIYNSTNPNSIISLETIAKHLPSGKLIIEYLRDC